MSKHCSFWFRKYISLRSACLLVVLLSLGTTAAASDSTSVREPQPPERPFGEKVLDVFSEILKLPVYPVKGLAYGAVWTATESPISQLLFRPPADFSVYPIASYSSNAGLKGGLGLYSKNLFHQGDILRLKAYNSTHLYQRYGASLNSPRFFGDRLGLDLAIDYRKRPWESFYGLGNDSREADEVSYTLEQSDFRAALTWRAMGSTTIGFFGGYTICNITDGRNDERPRIISHIADTLGLAFNDYRNTRHLTAGARVEHDSRDHPGRPLKGGREKLLVAYNHGIDRSNDLEFYKVEADVSRYFHLARKRVLKARALFRRVDHDESAPSIPFYLRSALGGEEALRGYRTGRFVDNDLLVASLEYRYPIWTALDGFVFYEQGRAFRSTFDDFVLTEWKYSTGLGVRAWGQDGELGRLFFAVSREGVRFYAQMGAEW